MIGVFCYMEIVMRRFLTLANGGGIMYIGSSGRRASSPSGARSSGS